jgi:hypothetical protein
MTKDSDLNPKAHPASSSNDLLGCPHCGCEDAEECETLEDGKSVYWVWCPECRAKTGRWPTLPKAKEYWNKRHPNV